MRPMVRNRKRSKGRVRCYVFLFENEIKLILKRVSSRKHIRPINGSSTLPIHNSLSLNRSSNLKTVLFLSSSSVSISKCEKNLSNSRSPPPPKPPRQPLNTPKNSALIEANEYKPKNASLSRKADYRNR